MRTSADYLDALRAKLKLTSDYQLAKAIGCTRSAVSGYRHGRSVFDDATARRVATMLGIDPGEVVTAAHAERTTDPELRSMWEQIAQKMAACVVLGVGLAGAPTPGQAAFDINQMGNPQNTHMRTKRRKSGASRPSRAALALSALARYAGIAPPRNAF